MEYDLLAVHSTHGYILNCFYVFLKGSVIVVIIYKDLHELLRRRELNNADLKKRR